MQFVWCCHWKCIQPALAQRVYYSGESALITLLWFWNQCTIINGYESELDLCWGQLQILCAQWACSVLWAVVILLMVTYASIDMYLQWWFCSLELHVPHFHCMLKPTESLGQCNKLWIFGCTNVRTKFWMTRCIGPFSGHHVRLYENANFIDTKLWHYIKI